MRDRNVPSSVRIGGNDKRELLQALRARDVQLNEAAEALFENPRFTPLSRCRVVEIEALSVADLGFEKGATYDQLTERARASGLVECPLELGPHLRLQFLDQAESAVGQPATKNRAPPGSITVASVPLDDRDETPKGFYLRRAEGVLWLRGYWARPDNVWRPDAVFVYAREGSDLRDEDGGAAGAASEAVPPADRAARSRRKR